MWHHICQGLMLLSWVLRLCGSVIFAVRGRKADEPSGAVGIFVSLVYYALTALVLWQSGAINTIVGSP